MAVYVIVIAVVVLLLLAAYRSLGGATMAAPDPETLLASTLGHARRSLDLLATSLGGGQPRRREPSREGRRAFGAAQQTLDRVPPGADLEESEATARALLAGAVEDLGWAWRMVAGDGSSPAITTAATLLADHAGECCAAAGDLLERGSVPALSEPGDRR